MAKPVADRRPRLAHDSSGCTCILSGVHGGYLKTVHKLLAEYQRAGGVKQQQLFVTMMHVFMQELCGYPPTSYLVTPAAYSTPTVGSAPHIVPIAYTANLTLFYFTASEHPDEVHDLWVRQAQVYLATYDKGDMVAECATTVVCTNFFVIDGARKDPKTGAWHLWSVSDLAAAGVAGVDLRILENETALTPAMSHAIYKRLQTLQYQLLSIGLEPDAGGSEALAVLTPQVSMEGHDA